MNDQPATGTNVDNPASIQERRTEETLPIYQMAVEMADRVSQRRQAANNFYLSVNTALIGASAYLSALSTSHASWLLGVAGVAISLLWIRSIGSYKTLNSAKFKVIRNLETRLPACPFEEEWRILNLGQEPTSHVPFYKTESLVPCVFIFVHGSQAIYKFPWDHIFRIVDAIRHGGSVS